jgi:hypothetical protein
MADTKAKAVTKQAPLAPRAAAKFIDLVAKTAMAISAGGIFTVKGETIWTIRESVRSWEPCAWILLICR